MQDSKHGAFFYVAPPPSEEIMSAKGRGKKVGKEETIYGAQEVIVVVDEVSVCGGGIRSPP